MLFLQVYALEASSKKVESILVFGFIEESRAKEYVYF